MSKIVKCVLALMNLHSINSGWGDVVAHHIAASYVSRRGHCSICHQSLSQDSRSTANWCLQWSGGIKGWLIRKLEQGHWYNKEKKVCSMPVAVEVDAQFTLWSANNLERLTSQSNRTVSCIQECVLHPQVPVHMVQCFPGMVNRETLRERNTVIAENNS